MMKQSSVRKALVSLKSKAILMKYSSLLLAGTISILTLNPARAAPTNWTPDWKSYSITGNPADILKSTDVSAAIGKLVVAINGQLSSPSVVGSKPNIDFLASGGALNSNRIRLSTTPTQFTLSLASDDGTSTVPFLTCDRSAMTPTGCTFSTAVKTLGMTFDRPIAGDLKGTGSVNFVKPDPTLSGSVKVTNSIQPSVSIRSVLSGYVDKWWQDSNGSYFSTNGNPSPYKMYLNGLNLYGNSDSFTFNMYNSSGKNPFSLWVDAGGNGYSQTHGGDYTIYAADGHSVVSGSPFAFNSTISAPYLPTKNPGSGSSFLCINASGSIYSSATACGQ